jgi:hypothetical protein
MNDKNALAKVDALQAEVADELNQVFENILPWTLATSDQGQMLKEHTEDDPEAIRQFLKSVYLFKITEVSVADDKLEDAISRSLGRRHQSLVTAAYQSDLTLTTVVVGQGGGVVSLYLGVSGKDSAKDIFMHQLQGIYPGKGIDLQRETGDDGVLTQALFEKQFGGIITGIPPVRLENERQSFDLTSVVRSMHGQPFILMTVARPVSKEKAAQQIMEIMRIKDTCHSLVKRTVMNSQTGEIHKDTGSAVAESESHGVSVSTTKGGNAGANPSVFGSGAGTAGVNMSGAVSVMTGGGAGIPGIGWGMTSYTYTGTIGGTLSGTLTLGGSLGGSFGRSKSKTEGVSITKGTTTTASESSGWSKSVGESLQLEQQNSLAMELELIADRLIKRLRIGLNSGIWEVFVTYATRSDVSSRILSGALCGELLKADPEALPSRNLAHALPNGVSLYLPKKTGSGDLLKGNPLVSHVSSEEASILLSPPLSSVPGFDVRVKPALSLTDCKQEGSPISIGAISEHGRKIEGSSFAVSESDIRKHVFVAGLTGSGKTTTVKQLLASTDVPFLVLESAKREYRRLLADEQFKRQVRIFTVGDSNLAPFRHNPFHVLPGVSALTHIDHLKSIFNASFSLYGPMPYLLEQCLHNVYRRKGWNLTTGKHHAVRIGSIKDCRDHCYIYPTIRDLINEVNRYVLQDTEYRGELRDNIRSAIVARMESLAVGAKGFIFNTHEFVDIGRLLERRVVFELESLADDDDKAFFVGLILSLIAEYRQAAARQASCGQDESLRHILVIEEAHRLLKHISTERTSEMMGNPKGKAVETFCNIIAEMRSFGQGVIVAEQIPTKIAPDVMKNTNTKVIHRLVSADDQRAIGASLGLPEADCHYLNQLSTGFALVHKERMARPIEVCIHNTLSNQPVGDDLVGERSRDSLDSDDGGASLSQSELEAKLVLHESGLLDNSALPLVARRLLNTIFLSDKELADVLPAAIAEMRSGYQNDYLQDSTVEQALEHWFSRILLSAAMDMGSGRMPPPEVLEGISRFWHEPREFNREQLVHRLNKWRGKSCIERIRELAATSVACEIAAKPEEQDISEIIVRELLLKDDGAANSIRETLRERVL